MLRLTLNLLLHLNPRKVALALLGLFRSLQISREERRVAVLVLDNSTSWDALQEAEVAEHRIAEITARGAK